MARRQIFGGPGKISDRRFGQVGGRLCTAEPTGQKRSDLCAKNPLKDLCIVGRQFEFVFYLRMSDPL